MIYINGLNYDGAPPSPARFPGLLRERSLFGIDYDGERRLPRFQFERKQVLPGLREVISVLALANLTPVIQLIQGGMRLSRVYYAGGPHPREWNAFRFVAPVNARWDHHRANSSGEPQSQERGIYYAARDAKTCLAEAFQQTRRIDRAFQSPWLVVFETVSPLVVLDFTGDFATRMGASMAIHSGSRERARGWARDLGYALR
jgi:hypothetical protein